MPAETAGVSKHKSKRIPMIRRSLATQLPHRMDMEAEGPLPPVLRTRLYDLFNQIEREFEILYAENLAQQEKIDLLNERLEAAGAEKVDTVDPLDGPSTFKHIKKSGSQISQKLKLTYKTSTSKIVSSFRAAPPAYQLERDFRGHRDGVWEVSVSPSEPHVIGTASADHTARIFCIETGSCLLQYTGHSGSINSIRFHPSQDLVVTASGDQTAHIWRAQINLPPHIDALKAHSSGEDELEGSEREDGEGGDSADDKVEPIYVRAAGLELLGHMSAIIAADWMPGGNQVITASWDRTANIFDAEKGEIINTLTGHDQELTNVCAHSSQKMMLTSSKDTTFRLWDFRNPAMAVNVSQGHSQPVTSAIFAAVDKVVSGSDDRTVKVWDLKNMRSPLTTIRLDSAVNRLAVNSSGVIAIPHDNRHIRLYDLHGVRLGRLPRSNRQGHSRMVCAAAWCEKETAVCNLFTCGFDRHVIGWRINLSANA